MPYYLRYRITDDDEDHLINEPHNAYPKAKQQAKLILRDGYWINPARLERVQAVDITYVAPDHKPGDIVARGRKNLRR